MNSCNELGSNTTIDLYLSKKFDKTKIENEELENDLNVESMQYTYVICQM